MNGLKFLILIFLASLSFVRAHAGDLTKVFVRFESPRNAGALEEIKKKYSLSSLELFDDYPSEFFRSLYLAEGDSEKLENLKSAEGVIYTEKIFEFESQSIIPNHDLPGSNDAFWGHQWNMRNEGQALLIDQDDIHSIRLESKKGSDIGHYSWSGVDRPSEEVLVAVLDSGLDLEHPDLKDNIFRNADECDENGGLRFRPTEDTDGNGLMGDCMGWNFTEGRNGNHRPFDDNGHGTHVAGIIAAVGGNGTGVSGVAPNVKILPVKVIKKRENLSDGGVGFTDRIAKGVLYAVKMKAAVINMSLGWPINLDTRVVREAIQEAAAAGVVMVAAAGNNSIDRPIYPCSYEQVICVGATTINGELAAFSNKGGHVDFLAPGEQILSTYASKLEPNQFPVVGYEVKSGTSQASPHVAGLYAYLKGMYPQEDKNRLSARLHWSASKIACDGCSLSGLVNLPRALSWNDEGIIKPSFKNMSTLRYKLSDRTFRLSLDFHHWGETLDDVTVRISSSSPGIELAGEYRLDRVSENFEVMAEGRVTDLSGNSRIALDVDVITAAGKKSYRHHFILVRDLTGDSQIEVAPIVYSGNPTDLAVNARGRFINKLRTATDIFRSSQRPSYYAGKATPDKKFDFTFLKYDVESGSYTARTIDLSPVVQLLGVFQIDLDYDGDKDILIRGIALQGEERVIAYGWFDENLNPLTSRPLWIYKPEVAVLDQKQMAFLPTKIEGKTLAVPFFVAEGRVPVGDKDPDPWAEEDTTTAARLYGFRFDSDELKLGLFTRFDFIRNLEEEQGLEWFEGLSIVGLRHQSEKQFQAGNLEFFIQTGPDYPGRSSLVRARDFGKYEVLSVHIPGQSLLGSFRLPVTTLDEDGKNYYGATAFAGMHSDTLGQYFKLDDQGTSIEGGLSGINVINHPLGRDHVLGFMPGFSKGSTLYSFYQTKNHLALKTKGDGVEGLSMYPLNRVSFIPGTVFNELFYPIVVDHGEKALPGFYIDATQLTDKHVYVISAYGDQLVSPMLHNVFLPENCVAMNPAPYNETEALSFLCQEGQTLEFRFLPLFAAGEDSGVNQAPGENDSRNLNKGH